MLVYMKKDLERVGMKGQLLNVSSGFAQNFLLPKGFAVEVHSNEVEMYKNKAAKVVQDKKVLDSKVAMLAEKIKNMHVTIKEKVHDDGKLYGAVGQDEIVEALAAKGIAVNRKQVEVAKSVKTVGEHTVTIRLNAKLKPELNIKVVAA